MRAYDEDYIQFFCAGINAEIFPKARQWKMMFLRNKLGIKILMLIGLFYIPQDVLVTTAYKLKLFSKRQAPISSSVSMAAVN